MVVTLVLAGLVVGRWWLVPVAAVLWPMLLVSIEAWSVSLPSVLLGGVIVGAANTAAGVAVHLLAVVLIRALRRFWADPMGSLGG
jgi:hypothetical protein